MRILKDREAGTYTLVPTDQDEMDLVAELVATVKPGDKVQYHGQVQHSGEPMVLRFNLGGNLVEVPFVIDERVCGNCPGYEGGITFNVCASDEESLKALGAVRDMCFFATGGLTFVKKVTVDDMSAICCAGGFCKKCGAPVIGIIAGDNGVCDACSENTCEHEYQNTVFLSPAFGGMVSGELCVHCRRMSPASHDRLKRTPKLQRLEEATAHFREYVPNFHHYLGAPEDPLFLSIEEAVALRNDGTVPEQFRKLSEHDEETRTVFNQIAQDLRERV